MCVPTIVINSSTDFVPAVQPQPFKRPNSPLKSTSSYGPLCRICHEGDSAGELISPCECSGSMGVVHMPCVEKWLSTSNLDYCEICKFRYKTRRNPRPIIEWLRSGQGQNGPRGFYGDMLCFLLLTPLCLISVYLCAIGSLVYLQRGIWEGMGLATLSGFVLLTYVLWVFVTMKFHWKSLKRWQNTNQSVKLVVQGTRHPIPDCNANRVTHLQIDEPVFT